MDDQGRPGRGNKLLVTRLIEAWAKRSGLRREQIAKLADFPDYNAFYQGYLNMKRPLNSNPDRAIGVVRAVTTGLPRASRATADEVAGFLAATSLPFDRLQEVWELFTAAEWEAAGAVLRGPAAPVDDELRERLDRIEGALGQLRERAPASEPQPQAPTPADIPDQPPAPAPLPRPHRMPLISARLFAGREGELAAVARHLRDPQASQALAITGIGGIGKTSLASEIVHRFGAYYAGGAFWLSCADPAALARELAACGESGLLQRHDWSELPLDERARLVTLAWQEPVPRLLVFDNCEEPEVLQRLRPTSGGCRVILTSRRASWSRSLDVATIALAELDHAASVALLRGYRPDLPVDDPSLEAIADELGGLPLALHLAGSYLETFQADPILGDPHQLLEELRAQGALAHAALRGEDVALSTTAHDLHVARTFAVSLDKLDPNEPRDAMARRLLARAALLAPGAPFAPELLLRAGSEGGRPALRRLVDLGLLSEVGGHLQIHRLIQQFARSTLEDGAAAAELRRATIALADLAYQQRDTGAANWLLPHAGLLAESAAPADEDAPALWNALPFLLDLVGDWSGGLAYLLRAHAALLQLEALESPLGAEVLNNLAAWHLALGNTDQVLPLHQQALAIRQAIFPPDSLPIAESHANLGRALHDAGVLDEASGHYERALQIALRSGEATHEIALAARNHLAGLLFSQQRFAEARTQWAMLVDINEEAFGADDPRTATVRNNLASALLKLGDAAARAEFERAVASFTASFGDSHPDTLRARMNAARALVLLGDTKRGAAELRALIGPLEAAYGAGHAILALAKQYLSEAEAQPGVSGTPEAS